MLLRALARNTLCNNVFESLGLRPDFTPFAIARLRLSPVRAGMKLALELRDCGQRLCRAGRCGLTKSSSMVPRMVEAIATLSVTTVTIDREGVQEGRHYRSNPGRNETCRTSAGVNNSASSTSQAGGHAKLRPVATTMMVVLTIGTSMALHRYRRPAPP